MPEPMTMQAPQVAVETEDSLLEKIFKEGRLAPTDEEREIAKEWVGAFVDQVLTKEMKISRDTEAMLDARIAAIDQALTNQLNAIMHNEKFQKLEASWRGLRYFVYNTETSTMLKIRVLDISKLDLQKDLAKASEFDQSAIFKLVHDRAYGSLGEHPYAMLVGDYEFGRHPQDIEMLGKMSNLAAAAHAPFLSATSPGMFGWDDFTELNSPRDLAKIFDSDNYLQWKSLRESDDSRYLGLCLPHILLRLPYGKETVPVEAFDFEENVNGRDHKKYLWGNAAFALATRVTNAFSRYEWCAAIRGVDGGGLVEDLPLHTFKETEDGLIKKKIPTEVAIPDRREFEFAKLGFIPLCYYGNSDKAAFIGTQSVQKPTVYLDDDANANANLSARLQYIFAASRFAHYLKAMMRDRVGSFMSREQCEVFLNKWIANFVLLDDAGTQDQKAKYPLADARVEVKEIPGKPGAYDAIAFLRPHFQLEEINISLRMVAKLPPPGK